MIIVDIYDGLGNQMFQYAFGRSLSLDLETEFFMDLSKFDTHPKKNCKLRPIREIADPISKTICSHSQVLNTNFLIDLSSCPARYVKHTQYYLNHFNIKENIINKKMIKKIKKEKKLHYYEPFSMNDRNYPSLNNLLKNVEFPAHFTGPFQTQDYFINNENIIREDFTFKNKAKGMNKEISENILNNNSVALHIRRGDYLSYPHMGLCTTDYYNKAIKYINKNVKNPKFFIFSNDPNWVKQNINLNNQAYFVTNNSGEKGYEDLRLMSLCEHFIIANSSFSWWGSWLSNNKNKIIIKPKPWFFGRWLEPSDIKAKNCHNIKNDYSNYFNKSDTIILKLNQNNYNNYLKYNKRDLEIKFDNLLNLQTNQKKPKIFLENIDYENFNNENETILNISMMGNSNDTFKLYYLTKDSDYYSRRKCFFIHYNKNEKLNIYFPLSKNILLNKLMIIPSKNKKIKIKIDNFELRQVKQLY